MSELCHAQQLDQFHSGPYVEFQAQATFVGIKMQSWPELPIAMEMKSQRKSALTVQLEKSNFSNQLFSFQKCEIELNVTGEVCFVVWVRFAFFHFCYVHVNEMPFMTCIVRFNLFVNNFLE